MYLTQRNIRPQVWYPTFPYTDHSNSDFSCVITYLLACSPHAVPRDSLLFISDVSRVIDKINQASAACKPNGIVVHYQGKEEKKEIDPTTPSAEGEKNRCAVLKRFVSRVFRLRHKHFSVDQSLSHNTAALRHIGDPTGLSRIKMDHIHQCFHTPPFPMHAIDGGTKKLIGETITQRKKGGEKKFSGANEPNESWTLIPHPVYFYFYLIKRKKRKRHVVIDHPWLLDDHNSKVDLGDHGKPHYLLSHWTEDVTSQFPHLPSGFTEISPGGIFFAICAAIDGETKKALIRKR